MSDNPRKAYVVAVDMGYGHQRAVYPLRRFAASPASWNWPEEKIISANDYPGMPIFDRIRWSFTEKAYESISRLHGLPLFGPIIFELLAYVEKIADFYPRRNLSQPILPLRLLYALIRGGFGKALIDKLNERPLPLIVSFPLVAFMAEEHGYKEEIYCLCTDTDIARSWAPLRPHRSRITYLAPTVRVRERLRLYGVQHDKVIVTGFPLPETAGYDNDFDRSQADKATIGARLSRLDPQIRYRHKYGELIRLYLGNHLRLDENAVTNRDQGPSFTLMFAIGGAGAQAAIALSILESLRYEIAANNVRLFLVAGTSKTIRDRFTAAAARFNLDRSLGSSLRIIYNDDKYAYFQEFNSLLPETDILWTKPSELSFYAGLGLPVIMSPALGPQEECNRSWLHMMGAGFEEYDPRYTQEWLFDWIDSGWLAEAAMNGYINAPKQAASHIEDIVLRGERHEIEDIHFV
ncbi:MAG: hypothetical protein KGI59_01010 [Patescibacteria group bacterium]|nr:hypothetical protein [Patescibacteria group bacterium]MDE2172813.1 hypothetical protein [Patescibacteria group bacterium]